MNIYEIKGKLNKIYETITIIEKYGMDTTYIKNEFQKLNNKLDKMFDSNSPVQVEAKASLDVVALNELIDQLYDFTKKISNQFKLFDDVDEVYTEINDDITEEKLNCIIELLLNDALLYSNLYNFGYKNGKEDEMFRKLYEIIKCEFRIKGSSTLLTGLINMSIGNKELKALIDEDIKNNMDKKDIYKRFNEVLTVDNIDLTMVYLLAINENDYKNTIIDRMKEEEEIFKQKESEYLKQQKLKKEKLKNPKDTYSYLMEACGKSLKVFIPHILSLSLLIGPQIALHNYNKKDANHYTEVEVYDTVLGEYNTTRYTKLNDDDVLIEVISGEKESRNGTYRESTNYIVKNEDLSPEEYLELTLRSEQRVSSNYSTFASDDYDSEIKEIKRVIIPTNIDYENTNRNTVVEILYHILVLFAWMLADFFAALVYEEANANTGSISYTLYYFDNFKIELDHIMENIEEFTKNLNIKESGIYNKELYIKSKKEYEEMKKHYNELFDKYEKHKCLLEYNGYTRKLEK